MYFWIDSTMGRSLVTSVHSSVNASTGGVVSSKSSVLLGSGWTSSTSSEAVTYCCGWRTMILTGNLRASGAVVS